MKGLLRRSCAGAGGACGDRAFAEGEGFVLGRGFDLEDPEFVGGVVEVVGREEGGEVSDDIESLDRARGGKDGAVDGDGDDGGLGISGAIGHQSADITGDRRFRV